MLKHDDPRLCYAQHLADEMEIEHVIVKNMFGGMDIKRIEHVSPIVNNPNIVAIVEPFGRRTVHWA